MYFFLLLTIVALHSCSKPCIESRGIEGAGLTITFFNTEANEYFYPEDAYLSTFSLDSLVVQDSKGNILRTPYQRNSEPQNPLKKFFVVDIYPIFIPSQDQGAFNSEQTKFIYLQYNHNTFDTIRLVYKTRAEKCANKYEYLKAYYRNKLLGETFNTYSQGLIFTLNH